MADSTHLQAGEHETYHVAGYNAMHVDVDTKYETTFKKAVQQTAPLDTIFPTMRRDPDSMTQQQTHNKDSEAYKVTCQMDATIKTHLKEMKNANTENVDTDLDNPQKTYVTDQRGTTDDAEMLAKSTYQQGMYKTYKEEDEDKAYPEKTAAPRNITNDGPQNSMQAKPDGDRGRCHEARCARCRLSEEGAHMQEILCQEGMQDRTYTHSIDVPGAVANDNFNTNSPEDGQTNCRADKTKTKKIATP